MGIPKTFTLLYFISLYFTLAGLTGWRHMIIDGHGDILLKRLASEPEVFSGSWPLGHALRWW